MVTYAKYAIKYSYELHIIIFKIYNNEILCNLIYSICNFIQLKK